MVQKQVELDGALGLTKVSPREEAETQACGKLHIETPSKYLAMGCFHHSTSGSLPAIGQPENLFWTRVVQDRGNLIEALAKLQHAKDAWGSRLFLVVTGERDHRRVDQLVAPLLAGTFHRLARDMMVLTSERVQKLYDALENNHDLLRRLLPF